MFDFTLCRHCKYYAKIINVWFHPLQAVLESKWPSTNTAYFRWNKVRNAIMVITQFRRNLLIRRRQSMCSMSGSDCDRISRGSIDSYLDETNPDKTDGGKKLEAVGDLVTTEGPSSSEEKYSTGIEGKCGLYTLYDYYLILYLSIPSSHQCYVVISSCHPA